MQNRAAPRWRLPIACVGFVIATSVLLVSKLHALTLGALSARMAQHTSLPSLVHQAPLAVSLLALSLFSALLYAPAVGAASIATGFLALSLVLLVLDYALAELLKFPDSLEQIERRCARTWVRHLRPSLRDATQIVLVRHIVDIGALVFGLLLAFAAARLAGRSPWLLIVPAALIYLRGNGLWQEIIHIDSHTRFLTPRRADHSAASAVLRAVRWSSDWVISQFFGMFPYWYATEHIGNHHPEVNSPRDVESLCSYDRTSYIDFCAFVTRIVFHTLTGVGMYRYLHAHRKTRFIQLSLLGATAHAATIVLSLWLCPPLACWLVVATLGFGFSLAIIAISDHGLADPDNPGDVFQNSFNMLWTLDDHGQYGGRYHLTHHIKPAPSWGTQVTRLARKHEAELCAERGTILFHSLAYPDDMLRAFWRNDPDFLYPYVIRVGRSRPTLAEWRQLFAHRVRPRQVAAPGPIARRISKSAARLMIWHVPPPS